MTAYVFPGQGSQFPGMGKDRYDADSNARIWFEHANDLLGFKLTDIMFSGTEADLKQTNVTQPAIFLHSVVKAKVLGDAFQPAMVAGHSLGEFSALAAADAIDFEDALQLVHIRATEMQKCCEQVPGTMAAVIGLPDPRWGEAGRACVVLKPGLAADEAELLDFMAARLARYKVPKSVVFRPSLPISAAGKILKRELRDEYVA